MNCKKCGTEMKHYIEGSSQITKCPNCGWGLATSYIEPIHEDNTVYSIIIEQDNNINVSSITEIKKYTNLANTEIINILKNGNFVLTKQKAIETRETIKRLSDINIKYRVEPEFKW